MVNEIHKTVEVYLSKELGESVRIYSSENIGGGCINQASKLKTNIGELFLKWNGNCKTDMFLREAESLKELNKASGGTLKVPKVYCAKAVDETPGFLILEYLPSGYSDNDDEELGRGLAAVHNYSNLRFGFFSDNYCGATEQNNSWTEDWVTFFSEKRLRFLLGLIQKERPLPVSEMKIYESLMAKIPELIPNNSTPVLIHGDLWSGNYMNTEHGPALIDPAAYYADREMEFAIITMFGGFSSRFFSAYNEINPLNPDWRSRNSIYQLYHVLNHYYLFGGSYRQQALQIANRFV